MEEFMMDNIFINDSIKTKLNVFLIDNIKNNDVNFSQLLFNLSKNSKISIVCKMHSKDSYAISHVDALNGCEIVDMDTPYYGLNPKISAEYIKDLILNKSFHNLNNFENSINLLDGMYVLHEMHKQYLPYLLRKSILQAASRFGFKFIINNYSLTNKLEEIIKNNVAFEYTEKKEKGKKYKNKKEEKMIEFIILGVATLDDIKLLANDFTFEIKKQNNVNILLLKGKGEGQSFNTFFEIKNLKDYLSLVKVKEHYSGVLPKVLKIDTFKTTIDNEIIQNIIITIEKTTFFTYDALTCFKMENHEFIKNKFKNEINDLWSKEDDILAKVFNNTKEINYLNYINEYLSKSITTNTIGVSANIESSDGYYFLAERSKVVDDSYSLYCSANGQSEFYDENVPFYNQSVYVDCPTLNVNKNNRIDFVTELSREVAAELGQIDLEKNWEYYGLSCLGINNGVNGNNNIVNRRFHFNVLAFNSVRSTAKQVLNNAQHAVEKFENENIYAIKLELYKNYFQKFWFKFKNIIKSILNIKSLITSILAMIIFILTAVSLLNNNTVLEIINISISSIFALIIIIDFIINIIDFIKVNKTIKKRIFKIKYKINSSEIKNLENITNISLDKINKIKRKLGNNKKTKPNVKYHAISLLMYSLYINSKY